MSDRLKRDGDRVCAKGNFASVWQDLRVAWLFGFILVAACQPVPKAALKQPPKPPAKAVAASTSTYPADFVAWQSANPQQMPQFEALNAYLAREGVADVLPLWQLIQTETVEAASKCEIAGYAVPPQALWPSIVPTLRLVRDEIVPLLGPVKVLSSFRTKEANRCSEGAPESPHKRYSALDLAMITPMPQKEMFAKLCRHWYNLPPRWGYGLGAYYVRGYPAYNQEGRFHVDTLGRRTWGYSYGAYTSHCRELGYIKVKSPEQIKREEEAKLKAEATALLKTEADTKAKIELDSKAKIEAELIAKAKKQEDARLKVVSVAPVAAKAGADSLPVKIIMPLTPASNAVENATPNGE